MSNVLLIYPPSYFTDDRTNEVLLKNYNVGKTKIGIWPPLGLMYLAAALRNSGVSVDLLDAFVHGLTLSEVIGRVREALPRIVGIAVTTMQVRAAVQIAEKIKAEFGDSILVAVGGPHISIDPEIAERFPCFDFAIAGEGEVTFPRVVKEILAGKRPEKIYRSELPEQLDNLPLPARDMIKINDYFPAEDPYFTLSTMRGCPFKCIFCSRVAISDKVRYRDPVKVVEEIQSLMDAFKTKSFVFLDDTFTLNRLHTLELCTEIIKRKLNIKWTCNTRANKLDRFLLEQMKKSGCQLILIGVESGDERFRNEVINKKVTDSAIADLVRWCKELKIPVGCYLMLGFPGETLEEIEKTVKFAVKYDFDLMSIHTTTVYPGSVLHELLGRDEGLDIKKQWDCYARGELKMQELNLAYIPQGLTLAELQKARKRAYLKFYLRPKIIFRQLRNDLTSFKNLKRDFLVMLTLLRFGKTSKDIV